MIQLTCWFTQIKLKNQVCDRVTGFVQGLLICLMTDWDQICCQVALGYELINRLWDFQINTNSGIRHPRVCRDSIYILCTGCLSKREFLTKLHAWPTALFITQALLIYLISSNCIHLLELYAPLLTLSSPALHAFIASRSVSDLFPSLPPLYGILFLFLFVLLLLNLPSAAS